MIILLKTLTQLTKLKHLTQPYQCVFLCKIDIYRIYSFKRLHNRKFFNGLLVIFRDSYFFFELFVFLRNKNKPMKVT